MHGLLLRWESLCFRDLRGSCNSSPATATGSGAGVFRGVRWRCCKEASEGGRKAAQSKGMEVEVDVAIVGGGLGGMALALGLQERGIRAHVFEKAPKVRPHNGTAISLAINGLRALDGVKPGLSGRMMKEGAYVTHIKGITRVQGEPEKVVTIPYPPKSLCMIPWKSTQRTLAEEILDQSLLHWRHSFVDYKVIEGGVEARFEAAVDEEGGQSSVQPILVRTKFLVGADGVRSQVRKIMVGEGDELRDLHIYTWNALIPTESVRSLNLHEDNEILINHYISQDKFLYLVDSGSGLTLWQVRASDASGETTKAYSSDLEAHGREVRKVRVLREMEGLEEMRNMTEAILSTHPDSVREARLFDRLPLTSWSDPSKRILLIGDAAHAMYPGPGEGARTTFEDVHQLCNLLQEAFASPAPETSLEDAVTRFEKMRIPRVTKIQSFAAELTNWPEFIPEWVQKLSPEEKMTRSKEYSKWVHQYPEAMAGDPESTFWKP